MRDFDLSAEQISTIREWAATKPRIEQVMLFGSRAKRSSRPDSDIDLAVIVSQAKEPTRAAIWHFDLPRWRDALSDMLGLRADIRITDLTIPCPIRRYCEEAGSIVIYER